MGHMSAGAAFCHGNRQPAVRQHSSNYKLDRFILHTIDVGLDARPNGVDGIPKNRLHLHPITTCGGEPYPYARSLRKKGYSQTLRPIAQCTLESLVQMRLAKAYGPDGSLFDD